MLFAAARNQRRKFQFYAQKLSASIITHMGGVDLQGMLVSLYRTKMRTHRWYIAIFSQLLDISINNAWLLYRRNIQINKSNAMSLKNFKYEVAIALTTKSKPRVGRPLAIPNTATKIVKRPVVPRPSRYTRLDNFDHFPVIRERGHLPEENYVFVCKV